jgi:murein DD-endopeptidase MepM/ murein hydrolase activator NlpD
MKPFSVALTIAIFSLGVGPEFLRPASKPFATKPLEVFQGEILELKVSGAGLAAVIGRLGKDNIQFYPSGDKDYATLIGIDLEAKAGVINIAVKAKTTAGADRETQIPVKIKAKPFQQESFSVATEFDDLGPELLERIRREQEQFDRTFAASTPQRWWRRPFILPVSGAISSPFGYRRVINGAPRAPHTGVDLKAPLGTEVLAANHGRVALRGDFFFSGKSLILSHGDGLYTMYFHLSQFNVEEGDEVHRGDVIALSGMTGRVSGPHLHWGARLNRARVDPFELIEKLGAKTTAIVGSEKNIQIKGE